MTELKFFLLLDICSNDLFVNSYCLGARMALTFYLVSKITFPMYEI